MTPENVLMGIRRGLDLAVLSSLSCPCGWNPAILDFWDREHGSGQGPASNLTTSLKVRRLSLSSHSVSSLWSWLWTWILDVLKLFVAVVNDLPARLEDLTTSVTLTCRHVQFVAEAAFGEVQWENPSVSLAGMAFRTRPVALRETVTSRGLWLSRAFW